MAYDQHRREGSQHKARCAVVTLSDTRTEATDKSGQTIRELLTRDGHAVVQYQIIKDEPAQLEALLSELLNRDTIEAVLTNGGTGISRRDQTVTVIDKML